MSDHEMPLFEEDSPLFMEEIFEEPKKPKFKVNVKIGRKQTLEEEDILPIQEPEKNRFQRGKIIHEPQVDVSGPFAMGPSTAKGSIKMSNLRVSKPIKSESIEKPKISQELNVEMESKLEELMENSDSGDEHPTFHLNEAAPLFIGSNQVMKENVFEEKKDLTHHLLMFQLPNLLPNLSQSPESPQSMDLNESPSVTHSEGKFGKLIFYRNGSIKMKMGNVMNIPTSDTLQTVACLDADGKKAYLLGHLASKMVCTPDIEHLLNS